MDLFGQLVIAHLDIPRSISAHSQNLSSLFSCVCSVSSLLAIAVHVNTTCLLNITCTLVAIVVILEKLECIL